VRWRAGVDVLAVDDDLDALDLLRAILEPTRSLGAPRASTAEALKRVERAPEHGGTMPVVALTAYSGLRERIRALEAGFNMHSRSRWTRAS
jgi:CheY-like chemotaxis protein